MSECRDTLETIDEIVEIVEILVQGPAGPQGPPGLNGDGTIDGYEVTIVNPQDGEAIVAQASGNPNDPIVFANRPQDVDISDLSLIFENGLV